MEKQHDLKFFAKPPKGKMKGLLIVFAWIILWNFIYQAVHGAWYDMPIANWAFFISVTIFFMQEELTYKARFWHTLMGGAVGLLLAAGLVTVDVLLVKSGVPHLAAIMIPLTVCIAALILLNPYLPFFSTMSASAISLFRSSIPRRRLISFPYIFFRFFSEASVSISVAADCLLSIRKQ